MTRQVEIVVGKSSGAQVLGGTITDGALDPSSSDNWSTDLLIGPQLFDKIVTEPAGLSDSIVVVEQNLYSLQQSDTVGLSDTRSISKSSGTIQQVKFGCSMYDPDFASSSAKFAFYNNMLGGVPLFRKYSGGAISKWNSDSDLQQVLASPHTKAVFQSLKGDGTNAITGKSNWTQSDLDTWWSQSNFPLDITIYAQWWHEPCDDFTTAATQAEYRRQQGLFCDYVHNNGPSNVKCVGPTFNGSQMFKTNGINTFPNWWAGNDPQGVPYYDYGSLDLYSRVGRADDSGIYAGYMSYQQLFTDLGWEAWINGHPTRTNKWCVGEFASANAGDALANPNGNYTGPNDPDGSRRGAWCSSVVDDFNAHGDKIEFVSWWSAKGNLGDFRLQIDNFTPDAWAAGCAATRTAYGW